VFPNDGLFKVRNECYDVQMGQNCAKEESRLLRKIEYNTNYNLKLRVIES
jgi:hypothetical protein